MFVRLFKFFELSWSARAEVKKWMKGGTMRGDFKAESFDNPSLQIATARNSLGESVVHAAVEPCFLISAYMTNPHSTPIEQRQAGDGIDAALARKAQLEGCSKLLILVPESFPPEPRERWVRIVERDVPLPLAAQLASTVSSPISYLN